MLRTVPDAWRKRLEIAFFVTPALAMIALFVVWPMVTAFRWSVTDLRGFKKLADADFVGFDNYLDVLHDDVFTSAIGHNLVIVVGSIILQLPLGVGIALLLNRKLRFQGLLRTIVFIPYVVAEVIAGVIWLQLLKPPPGEDSQPGIFDGLVNTVLGWVGLEGPQDGLLGTPSTALWTVLIVLTWKYLGLAIVLMLAGLQGVPEELEEAAQLDGASWWSTQWRITIPLLGPTIRTWVFLSMIGSLQLFDMVWILTGANGPADSTTTMATYLISEGIDRSDYGVAGAASVVLFVIALVIAVLYQLVVMRRDRRANA